MKPQAVRPYSIIPKKRDFNHFDLDSKGMVPQGGGTELPKPHKKNITLPMALGVLLLGVPIGVTIAAGSFIGKVASGQIGVAKTLNNVTATVFKLSKK